MVEGFDLSASELNLVQTFDDAQRMMSWLSDDRGREVIAVDTETGGLDAFRHPLRLVQFGDTRCAWAMAWADWAGLVKDVVRRYRGPLVAHNLRFDLKFLEGNGVDLGRERLHDSLILVKLLEPDKSAALKSAATRLIDPMASVGQSVLNAAMSAQNWSWETVPVDFPPYWAYACLDTVLCARLYEVLKPKIDADEGYSRVYDVEMACSLVVADMERRGIRVDLQYCMRKKTELHEYEVDARKWVSAEYGITNATSDAQVIRQLQADGLLQDVSSALIEETPPEDLWRFATKRTPSGAVSLDKEVLTGLVGHHPLPEIVLGIRKARKIVSTYLDNLLDRADSDDRVHCDVNTLGARTGRMTVTNPALQTIPRGPVVRRCFVPSEGSGLVCSDYDQLELRGFAHFAGEEAMIEAIHAGIDLHTHMAQIVYHDKSIGKNDPRRKTMKDANFAKTYCAGVDKFAWTAKITVEQAKEIYAQYDDMFPQVPAFIRTICDLGAQRQHDEGVGWVRTPLGRRLVCDRGKEYTLVNALVQSAMTADLLKQKIVELDAAGFGDWIVLPVHDEVVFDVPLDEAANAIPEIKRVMEDHENWRVPITCGPEGPLKSWAHRYVGDPQYTSFFADEEKVEALS